MPIENLKRWHWLLISVAIGFAGAWIMLAMGPRPSTQERTVGPQTFEGAVLHRPMMGAFDLPDEPIEVYPSNGAFMAMVMLSVKPTAADIPKGVPARLVTKIAEHAFKSERMPFVPVTHLANPPHFDLSFREFDVDLPRLEKATHGDPGAWFEARQLRERLPSKSTGFTSAGAGQRTIGEEGATLEFPLQQKAAELTLIASDPKADLSREVTAFVNSKALAPLMRQGAGSTRWTTTVPAAALIEGTQILKIARKQAPITITGVHVMNPKYSLVDFLADAKRINPKLQYVVHASWLPSRMYTLWVGGSVILIGIVWPTVIQMMARVGLANRPKEPDYDLNRFKGEAAKPMVQPPVAPEDDGELRRLEEEMERRLADGADSLPASTDVKEEPALVKILNAEVEEKAAAPSAGAELKIFGGEYYPVAKKVERVDRKGPEGD